MEIQVGELIKKAKVSRCGDGNYPVLSMTMHEGLMFQNDRFKKQIASVDQSNYQVVKRHQLVESFPIDEGVLAVQELTDEGIVSPAYKIWDVDTDRVIPLYLELALRSPRSIEYYKSKLRGTTARRRSITDAEFCAMRINYPDLREQERIIELINRAKAISEKRKQEMDTLDELIKARFVELFGDPEENPKGWDKIPLSDIIVNANNGMARRGNDADGAIVMRLVELQDGYIDYSNPNRIILNDNEKKRFLLKDKDFLFARVNGNPDNVGRCAVFRDIGEPVYHNDHIIRVHFNEELIEGSFASALFNSDYGKKQLKSKIKTSAGQYTVSQDGIGAIMAILPPIEEQNRFADVVKQVDKSKVAVQKALDETQTLFDSLMQEYFG